MPIRGVDLPETLRDASVPVLVDFHAEWCGPCRWIEPTLEEVARAGAGAILVAKVDTDEAPEAAEEHRITSVPTVVLFSGGLEVSRSLGVEPARVRAMAEMASRGDGRGIAGEAGGRPSQYTGEEESVGEA